MKFPFDPCEDSMKVIREAKNIFVNVPLAMNQPSEQLHPQLPHIEHSLFEEGKYLLDSEKPINLFRSEIPKVRFSLYMERN